MQAKCVHLTAHISMYSRQLWNSLLCTEVFHAVFTMQAGSLEDGERN